MWNHISVTNDLNVKSINLIEDNIRFKVISQECITSIKFVIRHFRISIVAMSKFVEQIGNTWIGRGTKRRKNRKGRRWPAKNLVHRSQHPNGNRDSHSFPHVVVCEYGPFMLLIVRSKYSRVAIIMNEWNNHVCYIYYKLVQYCF